MYHSYETIDTNMRDLLNKYPVKLIMGVRDPIKQNLSTLFQWQHFLWDLEEYWIDGGDAEKIFNNYIIRSSDNTACAWECLRKKLKTSFLVQDFFDEQFYPFWGVDLYQYPFDTEKGFSIYHLDKQLDVMVYQLEKLNFLEEEIGRFLEIEHYKLITSNDSAEKWYQPYYNNMKKMMSIPEQYFNECYNGKYIKYFYSKADINKFKKEWESHIVS